MALPTSTFTTYDAIGNREDLSDTIYDISPTETPFASGISRNDATATNHEWQTDSLAAATSAPQLEGDDATADARAATTRLTNRTQIFRKVISVSGTQRAVQSAGRADEYEYQLAKAGREIKRDIEKTLLSTQNRDVPTATATARALGGVASWLSSNKYHFAATSTTPGAGAGLIIGNAAVTVTTATQLQDPLDTVIASIWTAGGDPTMILCPANGKRKLSQLAGIATLYRDVPPKSQGQIINGADVYVSNFGEMSIVPDRFISTDQIYVLDLEYWCISQLRGMQDIPLAKTGDSDRAMLITECTLEAKNEAASGKISDQVYA